MQPNMKKRLQKLGAAFLAILCMCCFMLSASAIDGVTKLKDGAYLIKADTSYVNPDTGKTASGGEDSPMGKIMCDRYVGKDMLLEKAGNKVYVTFSMTGAKELKNFKVEIVDKNGKFRAADFKVTGENADKDEAQYRVELKPDDRYISPSFMVQIMKKQIQFFITPNTAGAVEGNGNFLSEMVPKPTQAVTPETKPVDEPKVTQMANVQQVTEPNTAAAVQEDAETPKEESGSSKTMLIVGAVVLVAIIALVVALVMKRRDDAAIAAAIEREKALTEKTQENQNTKEEKTDDD